MRAVVFRSYFSKFGLACMELLFVGFGIGVNEGFFVFGCI